MKPSHALSTLSLLTTTTLALPSAAPNKTTTSWRGFKNLKNLFIFGDSYTQTGFTPTGSAPSPSNPLGNPNYPGWTSSNGPNWVGFLTTTYNASLVYTYNLAYGGATVDSALVTPYAPTVLSLKNQVEDLYIPNYGAGTASGRKWTAQDSLFAVWIGINDVGNTWWLNNATLYDAIFAEYTSLLTKLYDTGARNFLLLNVPPINQAPLTLKNGPDVVEAEGNVILDWNRRTAALAKKFQAEKKGTKAWVFDTWALYMSVLGDVSTWDQTKGLKNVTGFCDKYANGAPTWYTKDPDCAYAVNEYFWLNDLHPTFPVHNATAKGVADFLKKAK
ncbi:hypothetical protein B0J11DRAFT_158558 [Dendryphion nanum]|uniref:Carbohydrate esterase family 16 protein n=1 Tax=Dendryphion nanum TaxID=256645 RepID=A0A9P9IY96_9PLEO|nr:hypothetical protein B0J11DRAFT_158558 [Dendryphion nanum]